MKKKIVLLALLLFSQPVFASVMISEVLYNPINTENGGEAVLLYNNGSEAVDVSGWILATKASLTDAVLPPNTSISAGGYLLIADNDFSLNKDNSSWPDADYEEAITLSNTNAGVTLMNGITRVDAIGWGDPATIGAEFYEGTPHQGVSEGQSLRRIVDTNNNSADFVGRTPIFYTNESSKENNSLEIVIEVEVNITNNDPEVLSVRILADDNSSKEGVQIKPVAGNTKTFEVLVEAFDEDNSSEIESAKVVVGSEEVSLVKTSSNETHAFFRGNVSMEYYEEAKNYNLTAVITSNGEEFSKNTEFEYMSLAAMSADTKLGFEMSAGNSSVKTVTVRNLGNTNIQLKVKGTNLVNGAKSITLQNIEYSTDNFVTSTTLTASYQDVILLSRGQNKDIDFKVSASEGLTSGSYKGQIVISGN
ncbi:MAG: lamin tail domain-containing protein [Nanoarchaeota archaeon]|nr:lamin tail domain-containing protein [DPANN group archaeon]MBL7116353.1 lamin tail domain-containing protein [Nanoarchaeota archaeon]